MSISSELWADLCAYAESVGTTRTEIIERAIRNTVASDEGSELDELRRALSDLRGQMARIRQALDGPVRAEFAAA